MGEAPERGSAQRSIPRAVFTRRGSAAGACGEPRVVGSARYGSCMSGCTAPRRGHRTASGRDACPVCSRRRSYYTFSPYRPNSTPSNTSSGGGSAATRPSGQSGNSRPRWSPAGSSATYTAAQVRALTPIREQIEGRGTLFDRRDIFLCHAWDDRQGAAKKLHDALEANGVTVWFSEKDVLLGSPLMREIDRGLAKSRAGLVLVTPAFLNRLDAAGIADKELSALLARDLLVPVVHDTTYEELRDVSPLLASRSGLSTGEDTMEQIALKVGELVSVDAFQ